jgi:hypothetical protein
METMQRLIRIADECDQQYISVTYDLEIAKIALPIQAAERPRFNKLFIQLGAFHIQLSFFKAVGKFIAESGGPYIFTESGVLAEGSLNGFLTGKITAVAITFIYCSLWRLKVSISNPF